MGKNSSTHREALSVFMERFPTWGLLAPGWEPKEIPRESWPAISTENAEVIYCYGLGDGSLYFQCRGKEIVFLEDDPGLIASFLRLPAALEILADKKVHIVFFSRKQKELEALAERFPVERLEVVALPSKKKRLAHLRLQLLRKTALAHSLRLDRLHGYQLFDNFVKNVNQLPHSFYANRLKGVFAGVPAVICGAGPSLGKSLETLRTLEKRALIIAGGSTIAALSSQGIAPHFAMAVDPNLEEYRRLKNSFAFEVPFLYSTRVHPSIFQMANGPFGYLRSGIGGAPELWIEEELGLLEPLLGDFLSPEAISVTAICIAWAQFLGCNPILLNGIDMAYTGNKRYAAGVAEEEELAFLDGQSAAADRILKRKDRHGQSIYTAVRWVMESASISHFAKKHPEIQFINTTEGGIGFKGIDYLPLAKAAEDFPERDLRFLVHQHISASPMSVYADKLIGARMEQLKESLQRVIGHLEILSGEKRGSSALAELELKEELAYLILFFDLSQIFKIRTADFWKNGLELAKKYEKVLR